MRLPTPSPTEKGDSMFAAKRARMPYYEDCYGQRNPDEAAQGAGEQCESESESDEELRSPSRRDKSRNSVGGKKRAESRIAPRFRLKRSLVTADSGGLRPNRFGMFGRGVNGEDELREDAVSSVGVDDGAMTDDEAENLQDLRAEKKKKKKSMAYGEAVEEGLLAPRGRISCPATRSLISQQLKEKALADKKAAQTAARVQKQGRTQELGVKKANGIGVAGAKAKDGSKKLAAPKSGGTGWKSWTKKDAQRQAIAYVVIDHRNNVRFEESQRM